MQIKSELEKRIENIEKKLNIAGTTVLTSNEKIVWDTLKKYLNLCFILSKRQNSSAIQLRCSLIDTINIADEAWSYDPDSEVVKAFRELGVPLYIEETEEEKEENGKN